MIEYGSGGNACYLIVQNGNSRKEVLEKLEILDEDKKRVMIRGNMKQLSKLLSEAEYNSDVKISEEFANFQNSGYTGLYNDETVKDIHTRKGLESKEKILDHMNSSELAANMFRISLTDKKLRKEEINDSILASDARFEIGKRVHQTIEDVGGILPEKQPTPKNSITEIERKMLNDIMKDPNKMLDE